ncbi:hypothetical protein RI129_010382 [Pyrocoelia pectoralis]|uniref:phospholipase A2 n=1 Tax=Pyrocoelia pectoralis TaxID=417401 RepID=A0AAN7V4F1_9COLE
MAINYGKIVFIFELCAIVVSAKNFTNFLATNILPDGEIERRIHYRGVSAKETTVSNTSKIRLTLRQLTDGKHFIQLIYDDRDNIIDCEYLHEKDQVSLFLVKFNEDLIKTTSNVTIDSLDDKKLPDDIRLWFHYSKLRDLCRKSHKAIKKSLREVRQREGSTHKRLRTTRAITDYFIAPGTLWCGYNDIAPTYTDLGVMSHTDKCCRKHDHCRLNIHGFATKFHYYNSKPFTMSHCFCDNRRKRSMVDLLQIPGTKWCGKGFSAEKYTHLGGFSGTDKCCRRHDTACPFWIGGFDTKYGLYNWRVNTLMHCSCDDRFRACLKMTDTSDANLVGKLFFNIVQTKCFVLKPRKYCAKRSWWGKCTKTKYTKQAVIRDNLAY